jgi:hypothetical protein
VGLVWCVQHDLAWECGFGDLLYNILALKSRILEKGTGVVEEGWFREMTRVSVDEIAPL